MIARLSLRTRLIVAAVAVACFALAVADVAVYTSLQTYLVRQADVTLQVSHVAVEVEVRGQTSSAPSSNSDVQSDASEFCNTGRESAPGMFLEVLGANGRVVSGEYCPAFAPGEKSYVPTLPTPITGFSLHAGDSREAVTYFSAPATTTGGPTFRVRASRLSSGRVLVVALPIGNIASTLAQLLVVELLITGAALVGSMLLGLWLVRVGLRPLRDVVATADSISGGDLEHRVPNANDRTEVGHVATALNVMLERIEQSFAELQSSENRLRQFVADASHELRTPVAAVAAYAELVNGGYADEDVDLPRVMAGIEREAARMGRLVDDLLLLARFDDEHPIELEPVELVGLVAEAVETARLVGTSWPITFVASESVEVMGDWSALRQVVDNLLANVRAHTPPGTRAHVRVGRDGDEAFIEVADEGPGITEEQASRIFERFFRADPSRSRATGGAGLGLAIVASILRAHGARASARPGDASGAVFRVVLPALAREPDEG